MKKKQYKASWAKIGNSCGYRIASDFFKENPEFFEVDGFVQVIAPNTVLLSRIPDDAESDREDELVLSLFLDFVIKQALGNPQEIQEYTQSMADEDNQLMDGVIFDDD